MDKPGVKQLLERKSEFLERRAFLIAFFAGKKVTTSVDCVV